MKGKSRDVKTVRLGIIKNTGLLKVNTLREANVKKNKKT